MTKLRVFKLKNSYKLPPNIDIFLISGKVENDVLCITFPIQPLDEDQEDGEIVSKDQEQEAVSDHHEDRTGDGSDQREKNSDGGDGDSGRVQRRKTLKKRRGLSVNVIAVMLAALFALLVAFGYRVLDLLDFEHKLIYD